VFHESDGRGQSEVVGVLLLVGVGIVLIGIVAVFSLGFVERTAREPTTAAFETEVTERSVTVVHAAGDPLPVGETAIVLRTDGTRDRIPLDRLVPVTSDDDADLFTAGEGYRLSHDADDRLQVTVVSETSGSVLHDRTYDLSGAFVSRLVRFDQSAPSDWSGNVNEGGSVTVENGGRTVDMTGNRWQAVEFDYDVTEDTVVAFEFRSDSVGEIHGVGFETDDNQESDRIVRVAGSQNWGVPVDRYGHGTYYAEGDGWVRYEVPIGEVYDAEDASNIGSASKLLFVNDCDGSGCSGVDSTFRNVRVYERDES